MHDSCVIYGCRNVNTKEKAYLYIVSQLNENPAGKRRSYIPGDIWTGECNANINLRLGKSTLHGYYYYMTANLHPTVNYQVWDYWPKYA